MLMWTADSHVGRIVHSFSVEVMNIQRLTAVSDSLPVRCCVQICVEGNIASGKTTCLEYFSKTSSIEVSRSLCSVAVCVQDFQCYQAPSIPFVHECIPLSLPLSCRSLQSQSLNGEMSEGTTLW